MRASSWNQISTGVCGGRAARCAFSVLRSFFVSLYDPLVLRGVARPCADVGEAELLQKRPDVALVKIDAEALLDDALKIDASPTHNAVFLAIRPSLDEACEFGQLLRRQTRLGAFRPVIEKAFRPGGVEAMNPVAQRLPIHAADLGRFSPVLAVADRRQRQQAPALIDVLRASGQGPKLLSRKVVSQFHRCGHGANLLRARGVRNPAPRTGARASSARRPAGASSCKSSAKATSDRRARLAR